MYQPYDLPGVSILTDDLGDTFKNLLTDARALKKHVFAEATQATYKTHLNAYMTYCAYYHQTPVPAKQSTIVGYVVFLARSIASSSIPSYLNIIRILHSSVGLPNPLYMNWEVNMLKRAVSRLKGRPPQQKSPITIPILLAMHL